VCLKKNFAFSKNKKRKDLNTRKNNYNSNLKKIKKINKRKEGKKYGK